MDKSKSSPQPKKVKKARIYIAATFNNTLVSVTDQAGNTLSWASAGTCGFKGARRATPFAATQTVNQVLEKTKNFGCEELEVYLKGAGAGREASLRALKTSGLKLSLIADVTPIPHNGVRPKKKRRV